MYRVDGFDTTTTLSQGMRHDVMAVGHGRDCIGKLHCSESSNSSISVAFNIVFLKILFGFVFLFDNH